MAHFYGGKVRRKIKEAVELLIVLGDRDFASNISISYLFYEDFGYLDNRLLSLASCNYNKAIHKRTVNQWAHIPLSLIPRLVDILKSYSSKLPGKKELGCLQEQQDVGKRIIVFQENYGVSFLVQIRKVAAWENIDCVFITQKQLLVFLRFFTNFCHDYQDQIKSSCQRSRNRQTKWSTTRTH
jgi:hypothetical protein